MSTLIRMSRRISKCYPGLHSLMRIYRSIYVSNEIHPELFIVLVKNDMRGESKRIIWTDNPSTKNRRPNVLVLEPRTNMGKLTTTTTKEQV